MCKKSSFPKQMQTLQTSCLTLLIVDSNWQRYLLKLYGEWHQGLWVTNVYWTKNSGDKGTSVCGGNGKHLGNLLQFQYFRFHN